MMSWIYWAFGVREPKNSINPNSMAKIPKDKFINYARVNQHKSKKQLEQLLNYNKYTKETYYDKFNH